MWTQALVIVLTSLLSSVLTLALAWFIFNRYLKAMIWTEIDSTADEFGSRIKQQVSEGVRDGIANGIADLPNKAAKSAARGGLDILEENLNLFLRGNRPKE